MTEPGIQPRPSQPGLDQLEAEYRLVSEHLARAETDYLELLEQTDRDRAALQAEIAAAQDVAANARAEAADIRAQAEEAAAALRRAAERDAADMRTAAEAVQAEAERVAAERRSEVDDHAAAVASRREQADHATDSTRAEIERDRAEAAALLEQVERDRNEVAAARAQAERELHAATAARAQADHDAAEIRSQAERELSGVRAHVEHEAERLRIEAAREAEALRAEAERDAAHLRAQAEREAADVRSQVDEEVADVASRREQAERLQHAAVEARTRAEVELADVLARQEQAERDLAELVARQAGVARQVQAARAEAAQQADRMRDDAAHEARQILDAAEREAEHLRDEAAREAETVREEAEREAQHVRVEATDALSALERLRAEHTVLRHSLGALAHGDASAPPTEPTPIYLPPRLALVAVAMVVLCAVGAYAVASLGDKVYGGRVEILVDVPSASSTADRQLATQRVLIQSQIVLGAVADDEGVPVEEVERSLAIESVGTSEVLRLTVGDEDPEVAVDRAQAIADRYLELIEDVGEAGAIDESSQPRDARLIAPARLLDDPIEPRPIRAAAGGGMAGVFLGGATIGLHVLLQRWRRSLAVSRAAASGS